MVMRLLVLAAPSIAIVIGTSPDVDVALDGSLADAVVMDDECLAHSADIKCSLTALQQRANRAVANVRRIKTRRHSSKIRNQTTPEDNCAQPETDDMDWDE